MNARAGRLSSREEHLEGPLASIPVILKMENGCWPCTEIANCFSPVRASSFLTAGKISDVRPLRLSDGSKITISFQPHIMSLFMGLPVVLEHSESDHALVGVKLFMCMIQCQLDSYKLCDPTHPSVFRSALVEKTGFSPPYHLSGMPCIRLV